MKQIFSKNAAVLGGAAVASQAISNAQSPSKRPEELVRALSDKNEATSAAACEGAPEYGSTAIQPLAAAMAGPDFEVARRCKRALARIVHHAGRPGAQTEATAVETALVSLLPATDKIPQQIRRELLWMLSEIGTVSSVQPIAGLLADKDLREDARCVLIRMPFPEAASSLKAALHSAPEEFKPALADALRARGEKLAEYPSRKLTPTAKTSVTPLPEKK